MSGSEAPPAAEIESELTEHDAAPLIELPSSHASQSLGASSLAAPRWLKLLVILGVLLVALNMINLKHSTYEEEQEAMANEWSAGQAATSTDDRRPDHEARSPPKSMFHKPSNVSDSFAWSLHQASMERVSNDSTLMRGILIPLYEDITALGLSLILELRAMDVCLPIEVAHCGDISERSVKLLQKQDPLVRIYNVCEFAVKAKTEHGAPLFCNDLAHCQKRFRSFDIKILSVVYSEFQEIMLMDADTLYFQSPMPLWDTKQYVTTGTLFFHDRIFGEHIFLNKKKASAHSTTYEFFLSTFQVAKYSWLPTLPRESRAHAAQSRSTPPPVALPFEPSEFLLTSNTWNRRAGHEMDSSLVMWNKPRQPRATVILASFVSLNNAMRPPSYGDKECFFIACELAEAKYAFGDFAVGNIGHETKRYSEPRPERHASTALCGDMVQFFPQYPHPAGGGSAKLLGTGDSLLYLNSDNILKWNPNQRALFRTKAKPVNLYEGSFAERSLPQVCAFNVAIVELTPFERHRFLQRQKFHEIVQEWL